MSEKKILGVVVSPVVYRNKMLFIKREREPYRGLFSMIGGKMDFGESIAEAIEREVLEETNIPVKFVAIRGIANEVLIDSKTKENLEHFLIFVCEVKPKHNKHLDSQEGQLKWVKVVDLPKIKNQITPSDYLMIEEYFLKNKNTLKVHNIEVLKAENKYKIGKTDL